MINNLINSQSLEVVDHISDTWGGGETDRHTDRETQVYIVIILLHK